MIDWVAPLIRSWLFSKKATPQLAEKWQNKQNTRKAGGGGGGGGGGGINTPQKRRKQQANNNERKFEGRKGENKRLVAKDKVTILTL